MAKTKKSSKAGNRPKKITFHYMKGPDFRTIHCDGAIGGITPRGLIHLAIFSERAAIPKVTVQSVGKDGKLGEEIRDERQALEGIVRQMEVDLFFGKETAIRLRDWINGRIAELEKMQSGDRDNAS